MNELKNLISHTNLIDDRTKCLFVCRVYVFDLQPRPKEKKLFFNHVWCGCFFGSTFFVMTNQTENKIRRKKIGRF